MTKFVFCDGNADFFKMQESQQNYTGTNVFVENADTKMLKSVCEVLELYYTPGIIAIGLTSNLFLAIVLLSTKMKRRYYSHIFAAISICDFGFIVTILLNWIQKSGIDVFVAPGLCQILMCAMHFFPFLSFWLTIWGSYGLIVRNPFAFLTQTCAGPGKARTLIISLAIFTFIINIYKTWTFGSLVAGGRVVCTVLPEVREVIHILSIVDVMAILIVPYVFITIFDFCMLFFFLRKCVYKSQTVRLTFVSDIYYVVIGDTILFQVFVGPGCMYKLFFILKTLSNASAVNAQDSYIDTILQTVFYTYFSLRPLVHLTLSSNIHNSLSEVCFKARESISLPHIALTPTSSQQQTLL